MVRATSEQDLPSFREDLPIKPASSGVLIIKVAYKTQHTVHLLLILVLLHLHITDNTTFIMNNTPSRPKILCEWGFLSLFNTV